jgi:hypothetical protein
LVVLRRFLVKLEKHYFTKIHLAACQQQKLTINPQTPATDQTFSR